MKYPVPQTRSETGHVSDETIQDLVLGHLSTHDSIQVQWHIYQCPRCLYQLCKDTVKVTVIGLVPKPLTVSDKRQPLYMIHDTADGFIHSKVERQGRKWIARHWGDQLQGYRKCRTMQEANEFSLASFREMFPEHRCTERCRMDATTSSAPPKPLSA